MKSAGLILLSMAVIAAATTPSEARHYRHHYCGYGPSYDYTHSNQLSALSYIFPAANWGPFFHCRMYVSPVVTLQPLPY